MGSIQLILILAYLLPVALLGLLLDRSRLRQAHKALLLALLPLFYIGHYLGIGELAGWPSDSPLPEQFILLGQKITEPDKRTQQPGNIQLWIQAADDEPSRLYQLPYSKDMHQQLVSAAQRQANGRQQVGRRTSGSQQGQGEPQGATEQYRFEDRRTRRPPAKSAATSDR